MQITIEAFKCYPKLEVDFPGLTVLCGRNGSGKSTLVQALLLHRIASRHLITGGSTAKVPLNGPYGLALGSAAALRPKTGDDGGGTPTVIKVDGVPIRFTADDSAADDDVLSVEYLDGVVPATASEKNSKDLPRFVYLSAEREGPRLVQEKRLGHKLSEIGLGSFGENSAEFLKRVQRSKVDEAIAKYSEIETTWTIKHLEHWFRRLFGKIFVKVVDNGQVAPPSIQFREAYARAEWLFPTHHGFGLTYALPILLAGLASERGDTLIIDSPEAHLHPAAQTEISRFLVMLAAGGSRVIIETHSDHIVDGLRFVVARKELEGMSPEHCKILFFSRASAGPSVEPIDLRTDGSLNRWPVGFFDQMSLNLRGIAEAKKAAT